MERTLVNTREATVNTREATITRDATPQRAHGAQRVKKYLAMVLVLLMLILSAGPIAFGPLNSVASAHAAQTRRYRHRRHRTFWQKHRDKLTLAGTTAGGAAIGGIAGGKKGAAIGSLVGLGGGALYTYKLRKRHKHRRY